LRKKIFVPSLARGFTRLYNSTVCELNATKVVLGYNFLLIFPIFDPNFEQILSNSPTRKYLLVVGGPTASGKTALAIQLAQHFGTEILSADSRQFYREMNIGTAKPSAAELVQAPHHFVDSLSIVQNYSVGDFERDALALLRGLYQKHDVLILTGGSGLFVNALCKGLDEFPAVTEEIKAQVEQDYLEKGLLFLQEELKRSDLQYYLRVDQQNPQRLMRALSVIRSSGQPFSFFRNQAPEPRFFTPIYLWITWERELLYQRINQRVDLMLAQGLEQEARSLYPQKQVGALQTVGYQEFFDHFDGKISHEEAIELIKRNSRRYAKRQGTWMRRDGFWHEIEPGDFQGALAWVKGQMR
jgi:tRNA dimethylallyltransferase